MELNRFRKCSIAECSNTLKRGATRYCSIRCCHIAQRKERRPCASGCGKIANLHRNQCCSIACAHGRRYRCRAEEFLKDGGAHGFISAHFLARVLRDYYGERCLRCGWSQCHPITGRVPVEVDHIDGNWQNNRLTNLTLLCPNCHALTPTYRGLNRGHGRAYRLRPRENAAKLSALAQARSTAHARKVFQTQLRQLELLPPT
jgi:hypothetical protein